MNGNELFSDQYGGRALFTTPAPRTDDPIMVSFGTCFCRLAPDGSLHYYRQEERRVLHVTLHGEEDFVINTLFDNYLTPKIGLDDYREVPPAEFEAALQKAKSLI